MLSTLLNLTALLQSMTHRLILRMKGIFSTLSVRVKQPEMFLLISSTCATACSAHLQKTLKDAGIVMLILP